MHIISKGFNDLTLPASMVAIDKYNRMKKKPGFPASETSPSQLSQEVEMNMFNIEAAGGRMPKPYKAE